VLSSRSGAYARFRLRAGEVPDRAPRHPGPPSKADAAMSRLVIAAGLKLIVVPIDSTWKRHSLTSGSRVRASHASSARAGRSRQRQSKWAGSTRRCTRTALVTAPFLFRHDPGSSAFSARAHFGYFRSGRRLRASTASLLRRYPGGPPHLAASRRARSAESCAMSEPAPPGSQSVSSEQAPLGADETIFQSLRSRPEMITS
jgi:hypothetical protein